MKTADFDYDLPAERVAQHPAEPRDASRLLVLHRECGEIEHLHFRDLPQFLRAGDLVVCNESRVIPARLLGHRRETSGRVEVLLLRRLGSRLWEALVRGKRVRPGLELGFGQAEGPFVQARVEEVRADGTRVLAFTADVEPLLGELGVVPLPPYIHEPLADPERYQTIYARVAGSVAAPTAGLHFTPDLLGRLQRQGVRFAFVVLHVSWDTFRPIVAEEVEAHQMVAEWCRVPAQVAAAVAETHRAGGRVVAVGTTSVRALETAALEGQTKGEPIAPFEGWTGLFIYPGYQFRAVDVLITNFHLPRSTLLLLVSAFAGQEQIARAYRVAIALDYRFYSFGDAMLIL